MAWIPAAMAIAGQAMSMMSEDEAQESSGSSSEQKSESYTQEPWAGLLPYLTGGGPVPEYLTNPVPVYNPNWLQWNRQSAAGQNVGPAPAMFQTEGGASAGYGGVTAEQMAAADASQQQQQQYQRERPQGQWKHYTSGSVWEPTNSIEKFRFYGGRGMEGAV